MFTVLLMLPLRRATVSETNPHFALGECKHEAI